VWEKPAFVTWYGDFRSLRPPAKRHSDRLTPAQFISNKHFTYHNPLSDSGALQSLNINDTTWTLNVLDINSTLLRDPDPSFDLIMFNRWLSQADGIVLLYDITSRGSFEHITTAAYLHLISQRPASHAEGLNLPDDIPVGTPYSEAGRRFGCVLVGNKVDLANNGKREVGTELAEDWAQSQGIQSLELDAWDREKIDEAMTALVKSMVKNERRDLQHMRAEIDRVKRQEKSVKKDPRLGLRKWTP
jgi:hypothetical protein